MSCEEYNGLTCDIGPGNYYQCICKSGYYWRGGDCGGLIQDTNYTTCTGGDGAIYGCDSSRGLYCDTTIGKCRCKVKFFKSYVKSSKYAIIPF